MIYQVYLTILNLNITKVQDETLRVTVGFAEEDMKVQTSSSSSC